MSKYRENLPQLTDDLFLTDGGLETTLVFHEGFDLPSFAAFVLLDDEGGRETLRRYYRGYGELAREHGLGIVVDTPTWRASSAWGDGLGYGADRLARANRCSVEMLVDLREELGDGPPFLVAGSVGPRGDGYQPTEVMSAEAAEEYHAAQIRTFAESDADMISALTLNYVEEAIGVARAAEAAEIPAAISFTVETDGRLPTGQPLGEAIEAVDRATGRFPSYYMVNCAHPEHFEDELTTNDHWLERVRGVRVNASKMSHAELDECDELDDGDPDALARQLAGLRGSMPSLNVIGGCCGTDLRHIAEMARTIGG